MSHITTTDTLKDTTAKQRLAVEKAYLEAVLALFEKPRQILDYVNRLTMHEIVGERASLEVRDDDENRLLRFLSGYIQEELGDMATTGIVKVGSTDLVWVLRGFPEVELPSWVMVLLLELPSEFYYSDRPVYKLQKVLTPWVEQQEEHTG